MDSTRPSDAAYLDWVGSAHVILGRPTSTTSLLVEHDGRSCLVAFTEAEPMGAWWRQRSKKSLRTAALPLPEIVERWGAPEVDLLMDPGGSRERHIPVTVLRSHYGLGPVVADGDGAEPLAFLAFVGGNYRATRALTLIVTAVLIVVFGLVIGSLPMVALGAVVLLLALLLGWSTLREVRAAAAYRKRLRAGQAG